ncbi:hypothetical protein BASA50_011053 [Batrachochytrium salamandrivorans]|uniref:Long chronological lifespan protein 2 n=1 Tax=Batrachochytrium salamandrivorans TaxID=1357716 RepID=A0ABQ8EZF4_9FUNG|nr:hypothetical protein BASA62_006928 [Batrachochytrium salamandrivorans]KAH6577511.1 hypothetical protein BASA60_003992 [Batrachochytrium salamandrivorans]KAH6581849.1 hypothetical protein BASA61_008856 [Batrachochytrium salamandrivorans]KAH6587862.1 hypothetical protein BASA50_011053 [Batrachochytrium salamandrivorans]KAH9265334.1 hypothetical protein BASA83_011146 [Batrachochytrium salamandrivorans]
MYSLSVILLALLMVTRSTSASFFDFFQNHSNDQQEEQATHESHSESQSAGCQGYTCPLTTLCVDAPIDCPCSSATASKCMIGDWYACLTPPMIRTHSCTSLGGSMA